MSFHPSADSVPPAYLMQCLNNLVEQFASVERRLEADLLGPIGRRSRPTLAILDDLRTLVADYDTLLARVREVVPELTADPPLTEVVATIASRTAAREWEDFLATSRSALSGVLRVRLTSGADSPILTELHTRASTVLNGLPTVGGSVAEWGPRVEPFRGLWRLLTEDENLSEDEADAMTHRSEEVFGKPLLRPAFFRKLVVSSEPIPGGPVPLNSPPPPPPPTAEAIAAAPPQAPCDPAEVPTTAPPTVRPDAPASTSAALNATPPAAATGSGLKNRVKLLTSVLASRSDGSSRPAEPVREDVRPQRRPVAEARPAEGAPPPVQAVPELPPTLQTFNAFCESFWLNPTTGCCELAPWTNDGFAARLCERVEEAVGAAVEGDFGRLARAYLFAAAVPAVTPVRAETVRDVASVLADPTKTSVGRDPSRLARLRSDPSRAELQLGLALEAVRPAHPTELPFGDELARLLEQADYREPALKAVVGGLIRHHAQSDVEPTAQLRAALGKQSHPTRTDWPSELTRRREQVHAEVMRVTLNAGSPYVGKFRHCGAAWSKFMTRFVLPLARPMYPAAGALWNLDRASVQIAALSEEHARTANAAGARENARRSMDRAVERLVEVLTEANEACRHVTRAAERRSAPASGDLMDAARGLVAGPRAGETAERLAHNLLARVLAPTPTAGHPLALGPDFFAIYPSLLDGLDGLFDAQNPPTADRLTADPRVTAATLLSPVGQVDGSNSWADVEARVREDGRFDRVATLCGGLPPGDQTAAAQERNRLLVGTQLRADRLRRAWRGLEALRVSSHKQNRAAADWAASPEAAGCDLRLVGEWLDRAAAASEGQLEAARAGWSAALAADPADEPRLRALREGRYDLAVRGLESGTDGSPLRETAWRADAVREFPTPRRTLVDLAPGSPVADKWTADLGERGRRHNALASLQAAFTKWVFGDDLRDAGEKWQARFSIETERLRRHLAARQPTYLPQLHAARHFVVLTAPESPAERDYPRRVVEAVAEHGANAAVVVLCPGMSGSVRDQLRRQFHASNLFAGTVDDLDLCRLLVAAGSHQPDPLVGLLEVLLEQQPWKARNPFAVPEGSEMRLEMYVGRREEAEQLATTADKTRLFSGRKLGKTALLHFIRQTYEGRELPNRQRLRVVYVSIVGVGREELFARMVLDQLRRDFPDAGLPTELADPTGLLKALQLLLDRQSKEDLLIVLDEADEFVATQVREEMTRKGQSLSWKLRGNPRVRYVFTGYWATSTRDGVWYNWGDVLELDQLRPEDAAGLVARPLARLGINAGDQAAEIAFRCGYQPAVLLRFGERLVERLAEDGFRECAAVDHGLIQDTFEDARVQTEIQGVVRANFQGNPFGRAVFAVVLRESARSPLGHWLRDLDQTVAEAVREVVGELSEESARDVQQAVGIGGDLASQVAVQLKDMHRRKLLLRRQPGGRAEYQLKFPHHLAALLADLHLDTELRANLRAWASHSGTGATPATEGRSPLRRTDLATLRDLLAPDLGGMVAAVGSPWPASLWHEPGGIPDRLGLSPGAPPAADYRPDATHRCWRDARPADLARVLGAPPPGGAILLGGLDLLRDGIDRRNRGEVVEPIGPHRMSDGQVRWWFQRNLGVEFPSEVAYAEVHDATLGVPLLIAEFQSILLPSGPRPGGDTLDRERVRGAIAELRQRMADATFATRFEGLLTARELDLLRMAHAAALAYGMAATPIGDLLAGDWIEADFGQSWARAYPRRPFPGPYLSSPEDPVAVETLLSAGFLPEADGAGEPIARVCQLPPGDPVVALLAVLG